MKAKKAKPQPVVVKTSSFNEIMEEAAKRRAAYEAELAALSQEDRAKRIAADEAATSKALEEYAAAGGAPLIGI